jgi:TPR repeat protein
MKYTLLALALITFGMNGSQVKSKGMRYADFNEKFLNFLPINKATYFENEVHNIKLLSYHPHTPFIIWPKHLLEEEEAAKLCIMANQELLKKNDCGAVRLLKRALVLDRAKILLAYCYRYGLGTKSNGAASNILLDLANPRGEDRNDLILELQYLFHTIKLGL